MGGRIPTINVVLATLAVMLANCDSAQSSCVTVIAGLAPCVDFLTGDTSAPSSSCCSGLVGSVQSQLRCLCAVLDSTAICKSRALELSGACKLQPVRKRSLRQLPLNQRLRPAQHHRHQQHRRPRSTLHRRPHPHRQPRGAPHRRRHHQSRPLLQGLNPRSHLILGSNRRTEFPTTNRRVL